MGVINQTTTQSTLHTTTKVINNPEWYVLNQLYIERNVGKISIMSPCKKISFIAFQTSEPLSAIAM